MTPSRAFREDDFGGYGAQEHWAWVLELPEFKAALQCLPLDYSRAWREVALDELADATTRGERLVGHLERISSVLPPSMAGLVQALVRDVDAPVTIGRSRRLQDPARIERLQRVCRQRLAVDGDPTSDADRQFLRAALAAIDPYEPCTLSVAKSNGPALLPGEPVHISATDAAIGSWWTPGPSPPAGFPRVGRVLRADEYEHELRVELERHRRSSG